MTTGNNQNDINKTRVEDATADVESMISDIIYNISDKESERHRLNASIEHLEAQKIDLGTILETLTQK